MLNLLDLPVEILYQIVELLEEKDTQLHDEQATEDLEHCLPSMEEVHDDEDQYDALKNLGSVCKKLSIIVRRVLFSTVWLHPQHNSLPRYKKILKHKELRNYVKTVKIGTVREEDMLLHDPGGPAISEDSDCIYESKIPRNHIKAVYRLKMFPNLQNVSLHFSGYCSTDLVIGSESYWCNFLGGAQTTRFRKSYMKSFFKALRFADPLSEKITGLSIVHLQDFHSPTLTQSSHFKSVLNRLSSLSLNISTEHHEDKPRDGNELPELLEFFTQMPSSWLVPAAPGLKRLVLFCADRYFGYSPKLNLSSVHFPSLEILALGKFSIAEDDDVKWIISHKRLRQLYLHDCPILVYRIFDAPHFVINRLDTMEEAVIGPGLSTKVVQLRELRWSDIFAQIQSSLPQLREFRFGTLRDKRTQTRENRDYSNPDMLENMDTELLFNRYLVYKQDLDQVYWWRRGLYRKIVRYTSVEREEGGDTLLGKRAMEFAKRCEQGEQDNEDKAALVRLLESIGMQDSVVIRRE